MRVREQRAYIAEFYIVLGEMGEGTTAEHKFAIALHFFIERNKFGFMMVDADHGDSFSSISRSCTTA